jgi:hypothetical protein
VRFPRPPPTLFSSPCARSWPSFTVSPAIAVLQFKIARYAPATRRWIRDIIEDDLKPRGRQGFGTNRDRNLR